MTSIQVKIDTLVEARKNLNALVLKLEKIEEKNLATGAQYFLDELTSKCIKLCVERDSNGKPQTKEKTRRNESIE